jgi:hypothetical protein
MRRTMAAGELPLHFGGINVWKLDAKETIERPPLARQSRRKLEITSSLSLLREPGVLLASLPLLAS